MSRAPFWYRTAGFTAWTLLVLAALKSEPLTQRLIGHQHSITGYWRGAWGCIASLPRLLAWQVPAALVLVPTAWIATRHVPPFRRHAGLLALVTGGGTILWLIAQAADSWNRGQILSAADLGRFLVFSSIAGTTVATPALLAFLTILFARGQVPELRSNSDGGAATKQREDFGNVVVTHVDAAT
jgi:hypothetical protein